MGTKRKVVKKVKKAKKTRAVARLSIEQRLQKVRPGDDLNEFIAELLTAWARVPKKVRVPEVSAAKLSSLLKKATKAAEREAKVQAQLEAKLAPLTDARLIANDEVYRAALAVKRVADAVAETQPDVAEAFAAVSARFRNPAKTPSAPT